jgi:hypothetical protein
MCDVQIIRRQRRLARSQLTPAVRCARPVRSAHSRCRIALFNRWFWLCVETSGATTQNARRQHSRRRQRNGTHPSTFVSLKHDDRRGHARGLVSHRQIQRLCTCDSPFTNSAHILLLIRKSIGTHEQRPASVSTRETTDDEDTVKLIAPLPIRGAALDLAMPTNAVTSRRHVLRLSFSSV